MGLPVAAAGTHPLTVREETEVSGGARYRALNDSFRVLARREPTMALRVHVGVPDPEDPVRLLNGMREHPGAARAVGQLSVLAGPRLRLCVGSHCDLSGLSAVGAAAILLCDYVDYVATVDELITSGAIRDPSFLVGRAAAAGARDRRGAGDGCPVSSPGRSLPWSRWASR